MTSDLTALHRLLAESLRAWRIPARATEDADGAIRIAGLGGEVSITRAAPDLPFRWMVSWEPAGSRPRIRPAVSVIAVLRQVRQELDPGYDGQRLRIAPPPLDLPVARS